MQLLRDDRLVLMTAEDFNINGILFSSLAQLSSLSSMSRSFCIVMEKLFLKLLTTRPVDLWKRDIAVEFCLFFDHKWNAI